MQTMLTAAEAAALHAAAPTYGEIGATRGELPGGYHHLRREVAVGSGAGRFERVAAGLMTWGVQRGAGLRIRAEEATVTAGGVAEIRLGLGPLGVAAPVRVVYTTTEERRRGFAYGTLPGHPESGEEAFVVELTGDATVVFTVTAFSRPASLLARAGGPLVRLGQRTVTARYLRAAARL